MKYLLILLLFLSTQQSFPHDFASRQIDGLDPRGFFDAFSVGDVVFIYRSSALPTPKDAVSDLRQLISVDRAAIHGRPGKANLELIDLMLELKTQLSVRSVSAEHRGDKGFVWRVVYDISPAQGGSTGEWPYTVSYVNPDGSVLHPDRYLCSTKRVALDVSLFSVLSFDDLTFATEEPEIDGEDALRIGWDAIGAITADAMKQGIAINTRYHDQRQIELPIRTKNSGEILYAKVWQVRFMLADGASYDLFDGSPIVVWIAPDGFCSKLTIESWQAKHRRTKRWTGVPVPRYLAVRSNLGTAVTAIVRPDE